MNRELTLREKVLLLILIVLVMVLGYFKLLYEPVSDRIARCREDTAQEQLALEQNAVRLAQMEKMEQALADIRAAGGSKASDIGWHDSKNGILNIRTGNGQLRYNVTNGKAVLNKDAAPKKEEEPKKSE